MKRKELVCIACPLGCPLLIEEGPPEVFNVKGNRCPRGEAYAQEEMLAPKRVVTATCAIASDDRGFPVFRRVPVKTSVACPKEKIPALLEDIYAARVVLPVRAGDILIANWKGEGIDVVVTRSG